MESHASSRSIRRAGAEVARALSLLSLFSAVGILTLPTAAPGQTGPLDRSPASFRYGLAEVSPSSDAPDRLEIADLDGDGFDEELRASSPPAAGYWHIAAADHQGRPAGDE